MFCVVTFFFLSTLDSVVFFTGEITVIYSSSIKVQFQKALKYKHSNICRYCICWCVTFQWKAFFLYIVNVNSRFHGKIAVNTCNETFFSDSFCC